MKKNIKSRKINPSENTISPDPKKSAEVQRILNLVSKMAQGRGGRLASYNRLTSFPSPTLQIPTSTEQPGSPKRKRDSEDILPVKRLRDYKYITQEKQPKRTPFILPETFIRK